MSTKSRCPTAVEQQRLQQDSLLNVSFQICLIEDSLKINVKTQLLLLGELVPELKLLKSLEDLTVKAGVQVVFEVQVDSKPGSVIW